MDWARDGDDAGLSDIDFEKVFKYEPKQTTVLKMVQSKSYQYAAQVWNLESAEEWEDWVERETQSRQSSERGLVLLLAKREGDCTIIPSEGISIKEWLARAEAKRPQPTRSRRARTFAGMEEKQTEKGKEALQQTESGRRGVRTLPFSLRTFKLLSQSFHTHGSIARVVSRADVPFFSSESAVITEPAYVYNCRSPNSWAMDLALSATYFPSSGLTFSIMYGCSFDVEVSVMTRLNRVTYEVEHPLLLPGIFTELEIARHTRLVESAINKVEAKIFALDSQSSKRTGMPEEQVSQQQEDKRSAWLDLNYLRNSIISWNTQLTKMAEHASELNNKIFRARPLDRDSRDGKEQHVEAPTRPQVFKNQTFMEAKGNQHQNPRQITSAAKPYVVSSTEKSATQLYEEDIKSVDESASPIPCEYEIRMSEVGDKIRSRIMSIKDECDEKIRDCTMRLDGMAMATQWSHGETNVEIALATNQDSKIMRSIALVTMIFLPGTFFATVFSMTFFDWFREGGIRISSYLWIYVVVTLLFTCLTIGTWYYLVLHRKKKPKIADDDVVQEA